MPQAPAPKPSELDPIDWSGMQPLYEGGLRSIRSLAKQFGCSHPAIIKHAKEFGWVRDLKPAITARADQILVTDPPKPEGVTTPVTDEPRKPAATEKAAIELNAQALAIVRQSHRVIARDVRVLANQLLVELRGTVEAPEVAGQAIDLLRAALEDDERATGEKPDREVLVQITRAVDLIGSLPSRVNVLKNLVDALHKLVGMEREAWGLNTEAGTLGRPMVLVKDYTGRDDPDAPPREPAQGDDA